MLKSTLKLTAISVLALGATACASGDATPRFDEASISADASQFAQYSRVYVADVTVSDELMNREPNRLSRGRTGSNDRAVSDRDLKRKADDLERQLARSIGKSKNIVRRPGDGVLTVQAEILDIAASQPTMEDYRAEPGLDYSSRYSGKANVRITISDGDRVLATVTENYQGDLTDRIGDASTWGDADHGFRIAASKVARLLS